MRAHNLTLRKGRLVENVRFAPQRIVAVRSAFGPFRRSLILRELEAKPTSPGQVDLALLPTATLGELEMLQCSSPSPPKGACDRSELVDQSQDRHGARFVVRPTLLATADEVQE
jgi:hypothetical protein